MKTEHIIERISTKFSESVRNEFGNSELTEINQRNQLPEYKNFCATQDYCDANEIMAEAFESIMNREINLQDQNDIELWNKAWDMSKEKGFKS